MGHEKAEGFKYPTLDELKASYIAVKDHVSGSHDVPEASMISGSRAIQMDYLTKITDGLIKDAKDAAKSGKALIGFMLAVRQCLRNECTFEPNSKLYKGLGRVILSNYSEPTTKHYPHDVETHMTTAEQVECLSFAKGYLARIEFESGSLHNELNETSPFGAELSQAAITIILDIAACMNQLIADGEAKIRTNRYAKRYPPPTLASQAVNTLGNVASTILGGFFGRPANPAPSSRAPVQQTAPGTQ